MKGDMIPGAAVETKRGARQRRHDRETHRRAINRPIVSPCTTMEKATTA